MLNVFILAPFSLWKDEWHTIPVKAKSCLYVSLYGLESLQEIKQAVCLQQGHRVFSRLINILKPHSDALLTELLFRRIRGQHICFDDLERISDKVPVKDVMGLVSYLKEERSCNVLVITVPEKIEDEKQFANYKEKLFDKELSVDSTPEDSAQLMLERHKDSFPTLYELAITKRLGPNIVNLRTWQRIIHAASDLEEALKKSFNNQEQAVADEIREALYLLLMTGQWVKDNPQHEHDEALPDWPSVKMLFGIKDEETTRYRNTHKDSADKSAADILYGSQVLYKQKEKALLDYGLAPGLSPILVYSHKDTSELQRNLQPILAKPVVKWLESGCLPLSDFEDSIGKALQAHEAYQQSKDMHKPWQQFHSRLANEGSDDTQEVLKQFITTLEQFQDRLDLNNLNDISHFKRVLDGTSRWYDNKDKSEPAYIQDIKTRLDALIAQVIAEHAPKLAQQYGSLEDAFPGGVTDQHIVESLSKAFEAERSKLSRDQTIQGILDEAIEADARFLQPEAREELLAFSKDEFVTFFEQDFTDATHDLIDYGRIVTNLRQISNLDDTGLKLVQRVEEALKEIGHKTPLNAARLWKFDINRHGEE